MSRQLQAREILIIVDSNVKRNLFFTPEDCPSSNVSAD
jgi:hypothetical protein